MYNAATILEWKAEMFKRVCSNQVQRILDYSIQEFESSSYTINVLSQAKTTLEKVALWSTFGNVSSA